MFSVKIFTNVDVCVSTAFCASTVSLCHSQVDLLSAGLSCTFPCHEKYIKVNQKFFISMSGIQKLLGILKKLLNCIAW